MSIGVFDPRDLGGPGFLNEDTGDPDLDDILNALGREPEWRRRGYPSPEAYAAAVGAREAQESRLRDAQIAQALAQTANVGSATGVSLARLGLDREQALAAIAENVRQFNETLGFNKGRFNAEQGLAEAKFEWERAVNAGDRDSAERWKQRYFQLDAAKDTREEGRFGLEQGRFGLEQRRADLEDRRFGLEQNRDVREQNELAFRYLQSLMESRKGPQDWVDYWYRSRGQTPPAGSEPVAFEDALPPWAQPRALPAAQSAATTSTNFGAAAAPAAAAAIPTATGTTGPTLPAWAGGGRIWRLPSGVQVEGPTESPAEGAVPIGLITSGPKSKPRWDWARTPSEVVPRPTVTIDGGRRVTIGSPEYETWANAPRWLPGAGR